MVVDEAACVMVVLATVGVTVATSGCGDVLLSYCISSDFEKRGAILLLNLFLSLVVETLSAGGYLSFITSIFYVLSLVTTCPESPQWIYAGAQDRNTITLLFVAVVATVVVDVVVAFYRATKFGLWTAFACVASVVTALLVFAVSTSAAVAWNNPGDRALQALAASQVVYLVTVRAAAASSLRKRQLVFHNRPSRVEEPLHPLNRYSYKVSLASYKSHVTEL